MSNFFHDCPKIVLDSNFDCPGAIRAPTPPPPCTQLKKTFFEKKKNFLLNYSEDNQTVLYYFIPPDDNLFYFIFFYILITFQEKCFEEKKLSFPVKRVMNRLRSKGDKYVRTIGDSSFSPLNFL